MAPPLLCPLLYLHRLRVRFSFSSSTHSLLALLSRLWRRLSRGLSNAGRDEMHTDAPSSVALAGENSPEPLVAANSSDHTVIPYTPTRPEVSPREGSIEQHDSGPSNDLLNAQQPLHPNPSRAPYILDQVPEGWRPQPFSPEDTGRYDRVNLVEKDDDHKPSIPPLKTSWPHSIETDTGAWEAVSCGDWNPTTHPEGGLYFYHAQHRAFTDNYMYDKDERQEVEEFLDCLLGHLSSSVKRLPSDECELVLEIKDGDDGIRGWYYYYIDHKSRGLFWLQPYDSPLFFSDVHGKKNPSHTKLAIESQYWMHWSLYPVGQYSLPEGTMDELQGMLIGCAVDTVTSSSSTSPYGLMDLRTFISLIEKGSSLSDPSRNADMVWAVARLMSFFLHWKFIHFHGEKHARLVRERSAYTRGRRRTTWLLSIFSPICFFAPEVHLTDLEKIFTDDVVNNPLWKPVITKLLDEWQQLVLFGTVLLNANVAFLDISYVGDTAQAGLSQLLSYISTVASTGSIVLSLLFIRQNYDRGQRMVPVEVATSIYHRMEALAIIYSVPYALLMWSMLTFVVAFLILCFDDSNLSTRVSVGSTFLVILVVTIWCLATSMNIAILERLFDISERSAMVCGHAGRRAVQEVPSWRTSRLSLWTSLGTLLGFRNVPTASVPHNLAVYNDTSLTDV